MNGIPGKAMKWFGEHKKTAVALFLVLAGAGYYFWSYRSSTGTDEAVNVRIGTVSKESLSVTVTGSGQVHAKDEVALNPVAAGDAIDVMRVEVENDKEVKKDDLIAVLDTSSALESIRDAELSLWSAEIKMDQAEEEYDSLAKDDRQARQMQEIPLKQAENRLSEAEDDLEDYYIRAPFDGVVTGLSVVVGDSVSRSDTIASVISKEMYAGISLNEVDAVGVDVGDRVTLSFTALDDATVEGKVSKIDTIGTVSQGVASYDAEITFDSSELPKLKPGMSVDVEIVTEEKDGVLSVPIAAVGTGPGGGSFVWVPSEEDALGFRRVRVETGISTDTAIEIVEGLSEGQEIALSADSVSSSVTTGTRTGTTKTEDAASSLMRIPGAGTGSGMGSGMGAGM